MRGNMSPESQTATQNIRKAKLAANRRIVDEDKRACAEILVLAAFGWRCQDGLNLSNDKLSDTGGGNQRSSVQFSSV